MPPSIGRPRKVLASKKPQLVSLKPLSKNNFIKRASAICLKGQQSCEIKSQSLQEKFQRQQLSGIEARKRVLDQRIKKQAQRLMNLNQPVDSESHDTFRGCRLESLTVSDELDEARGDLQAAEEQAQAMQLVLDQQLQTQASTIPAFSELVKGALMRQGNPNIGKEHQCNECLLSFDKKWLLTRHQNRAHRKPIAWVKSKSLGAYDCRVCSLQLASIYALKKHVFFQHSEADVQAQYGLSMEKYIGGKYLEEFRKVIYRSISLGRFNSLVERALGGREEFKISSLCFKLPIIADLDIINKERRKLLYNKRRDLLCKLAEEAMEDMSDHEPFSRRGDPEWEHQLIEFDLAHSLCMESIPNKITRCIKIALQSEKDKSPFLPKFVKFVRNGAAAWLQLSSLPTMLRTVIGRRLDMLKMGPNIITQLLMGLVTLKEQGLVVQNLQPSTIFINYDGTLLNFADITQICQDEDPQPYPQEIHLPYRYSFIRHHHYQHEALFVKDRYSLGMIILEILLGSELVLAAQTEELVEKLLDDCSTYLDGATQALLWFLTLNVGELNLKDFVDHFIGGERDVIRADILRVEEALMKDPVLQEWQLRGKNWLHCNKKAAYVKYRAYPYDIRRDIGQEAVAAQLREDMEAI